MSIPDDKVLAPGVITSTTNYVDHPRRVAQLLQPYIDLVGSERVIASTDCGFGTFAGIGRVDPGVVDKKLASLVEGAALASDRSARSSTDVASIVSACERLVLDSAAFNDEADWAALAELYSIDAVLTRPSGQVIEGRDAIERSYRSGSTDRRTRHICSNVRVTVDRSSAASASASTLVQLYAWTAPPEATDALPSIGTATIGEFADTFVLTEDGWRIASRTARLIGRAS